VAELEAWEAEKQRYKLDHAGTGVFAYRLQGTMAGSEPIHCICATCYQHGKKSILQRHDRGMNHYLHCPECNADIKIGEESFVPPQPRPKRPY
jgi:hypothetical protein